jgi:ornithine cyclodeaminase
MLVLSADDVRKALPMPQAIVAMREAFAALSSGKADVPMRTVLSLPDHAATTLVMPASVAGAGGEALAVKVVSLFPRNRQRGLALIQAAVVLLDGATGRPLALLEGASLTAIRTGAASGLATELLARPESRVVAILGSGVQARTQLEAVSCVRRIEFVRVFSPHSAHAEAFAAEVRSRGAMPRDVRRSDTASQAVSGADIVCAATTSAVPVFADEDISPGAHINAIGSFRPDAAEVPAATVARATVVVDQRQAALEEAGDIIQPLRQGWISAGHIRAELGELVLGRVRGRTLEDEVTLFKSVGNAAQDAVAARVAFAEAEKLGLGTRVEW